MSRHSIQLDSDVHQYLIDHGVRETTHLRALRLETAEHEMARMQISSEQGQFMKLLVKMLGATRAIEVGTFTGYSALCVADAMGSGGTLVACDVSEEYTSIARRAWAAAGVSDRIDLRIAPAIETLDALIAEGGAGTYDFAFIDADKENYGAYYERCLTLLRVGGVVGIDNVLWGGDVVDSDNNASSTVAIRAVNTALRSDERVDISMVPIGDGLTLARKR